MAGERSPGARGVALIHFQHGEQALCSSRSIGTRTRLESIPQRESPPVDVELVGHEADRLSDLCDQPGKLLSRAVHMVFSGILTAAMRHLRSKLRLLY
jgi:hypothetical protein